MLKARVSPILPPRKCSSLSRRKEIVRDFLKSRAVSYILDPSISREKQGNLKLSMRNQCYTIYAVFFRLTYVPEHFLQALSNCLSHFSYRLLFFIIPSISTVFTSLPFFPLALLLPPVHPTHVLTLVLAFMSQAGRNITDY